MFQTPIFLTTTHHKDIQLEHYDPEDLCGHPKCTVRACLSAPHLKVIIYGEVSYFIFLQPHPLTI